MLFVVTTRRPCRENLEPNHKTGASSSSAALDLFEKRPWPAVIRAIVQESGNGGMSSDQLLVQQD